MWENIGKPWQEAFKLAWEAYERGTIPIGCVIVTKDGKIISKGRNRIFDKVSKNPLAGCNMAHAEMTAMLGLREWQHPEIKSYILYTTMEPCPMCFGTMVMMNFRSICYGARDSVAGAIVLNDKIDYIKSKKMAIQQGSEEIEIFQLILQSAYELEREHPKVKDILYKWSTINKDAIEYAKKLYNEKYFQQAIKMEKTIEVVYSEVLSGYFKSF